MPVVEGSVDIDGEGYADESLDDESTSEVEPQDIKNSSTSEEGAEKESESKEDLDQDQEGVKPTDKTEKGTKLAQDPLQQANQLRANAESQLKQYEAFLSDPTQIEAYLADLKSKTGGEAKTQTPTEVEKQAKEVLSVDPDKIETVEDLKNYAKSLRQTVMDQIESVKKEIGGMREGQARTQFAQKFDSTVNEVRDKYPMLRPNNPDGTPNPNFDADFDEKLGKLYEKLDFDPVKKEFRGKVDFMDLADTLASMRAVGQKAGSTQAQTIVKDKTRGKIAGSPADASSSVDESKLSASQIIASRIKKARQASRSRR